MNSKINIGIIGCGHWGPNFVRNFSQIPNAFVRGVCDLDKRKLKHIKQLYPLVKVFTDYKRILDDRVIDAVVISTPAITHYKLTKEALDKGKHVLVEKPIALVVNEAEELIELSKNTGRVLMIGHTFLYNQAVNKIKDVIRKKELGRIYYLHSKRTNLGPLRKDVSAMWDLASHDISIFHYLLETNPVEVIARGQDYLQKGKEDVSFITLTYPKGVIANIHVSWLDPRKVREITIVGSKKMLVFDDLNFFEPIRIYDKRVTKRRCKQDYDTFEQFQMLIREGQVITPRIKVEEPLKVECIHFLECVMDGKAPITGGRNGLDILKVLTTVQKSLDKDGEAIPF